MSLPRRERVLRSTSPIWSPPSFRTTIARHIVAASRLEPSLPRRSSVERGAHGFLGGRGGSLLRARLRAPLIAAAPAVARQHARQLPLGDEDLPRLRALVTGDDPASLEHVDQASCAGVAHPQATLEHGYRRRLALDDDARRLVQEVVAVRREVVLAIALGLLVDLEEGRVELRLALARPVLGYPCDLVLGHERPLEALQSRRPDGPEEHVALPKESLG